MIKLLLLIVFSNLLFIASNSTDKIVCYYGSWSVYRTGKGQFQIDHIDPHKCTHLIYSFVGLNIDGSIKILDHWNDVQNEGFTRFVSLREQNVKLKLMVAIGGWNEGSMGFSQVAASENLRETFADNVVSFLRQYNFDGFDLDWEYPAQRGGSWEDKENFVGMIKALRKRFDQSGKNYLLSAAVGVSSYSMEVSYNVPEMAKYLDFINLMEYDFKDWWSGTAGLNAPLYSFNELNVADSVLSWINAGAPAEKLVLGLAMYGHSFYLTDPNNSGLGAPVTNPGNAGKYTQQPGMLGYNEICELQMEKGWILVFLSQERVPYMFKDHQWISYDDISSIKEKVEFAKSLNLGGVMIWSIETDDFLGVCGQKYPLLSTINFYLPINPVDPTPSASATTSTVKPTTTTLPATGGNECVEEGFMRDLKVCSVFYYCQSNGFGGFYKSTFKCSASLVFDDIKKVCNYPSEVNC